LAEEAVHDTFVQIRQKVASFDPVHGEGRSGLYAILRDRALRLTLAEVPQPHSNQLFAISGEPLAGSPKGPVVMKRTAAAAF
jgi:anti-sigma-K factor RskA